MSSGSASEAESVVINSGPLIALARGSLLHVLGQLPIRFFCPEEVCQELDQGAARGLTPVPIPSVQVQVLAGPLSDLLRASLGDGEAEAETSGSVLLLTVTFVSPAV